MTAHMLGLIYARDYSWLPEYTASVPEIVRKYGGEYNFVAARGTIELAEGDAEVPTGVVVFNFPSREAAFEFMNCEEYKPFIELRSRHSKAQIFIFDGRFG